MEPQETLTDPKEMRTMRLNVPVAGRGGSDYWLLDRLGTLGQPGRRFTRHRTPTPTPA